MAESLRPGILLLSSPRLLDPNFEDTVVLLCAHEPGQGSLGLVLNRPLPDLRLEDLLGPDQPFGEEAPAVWWGGPVRLEQLHSLWEAPGGEEEGLEVLPGLHFGGPLERLAALRPEGARVRLYLGYSGWSAGQLESEMEQDAWRLLPARKADVFDERPTTLWQRLIARVEPGLSWLEECPEDPSVN